MLFQRRFSALCLGFTSYHDQDFSPGPGNICERQLPSEMSQLKRKSPDASPDTDRDDAPSKRLKAKVADQGVEGTERAGDDRSRSPKDRRVHKSRRRDSFSPPRRAERRDSEVSRRESVAMAPKDRSSRNSFSQEDKKRGKRLFGGLLSTLSQTTSNSQQKRRQEVEKRQQERATKQRIEDDKRRLEKLAKLDKIRKIEQVRFDEQVMRTRHANMRSMAHCLQSKCEPKLYYRPWQLTPEQENTIKDQIRDIQSKIEDELQRFERQKEQRLKELGVLALLDDSAGETVEDRSNMAAKDESAIAAASATNEPKDSPVPAQEPRNTTSHEEKDDEMVEAEEDTVIY